MDFLDLESAYKHLEQYALDYKYLHQIAEIFQKIRDEMHRKQKIEEETQAQWEVDIFNFSIEDNVVKPLCIMTNDKGEEIKYPSYDRFADATYDYIAKRLRSTTHPSLRARYAHILWFSPRKHGKYAEIAIDAYLKLVKLYEQKDREKPHEHFGLDTLNATKNTFLLSLDSNDEKRLNLSKSEVKRLVFSFNSESSSLFALRAGLISLMLDKKRVFLKDNFIGMNEMCFKFAQGFAECHKSITMLELGEKIDEKLGITTFDWKKSIAECNEKMMRSCIEKNKLVAIKFCQDALKYYRQLKNPTKIEELEKIYDKLKDEVELKKFKMEIELGDYIKTCEKKAKEIAQYSSEQIYELLTLNKALLPTHAKMKSLAEEMLKEHPLQGIFPMVMIDERGHNVQHFSSEEEVVYYHTLSQYQLYLQTQYLPLINAIILEALKEKKMTYSSLIDSFRRHYWFGKTIKKKNQNQDIEYNWMNQLAPSLSKYFEEMEYLFASGKRPNLVLCIDSLIVKIEGLLRDLCNYSGIFTFSQTTDNQGRIIYLEKDLNALLHEEKIRDLFDEDELLFFRFVLVEKAGYNLRHKIAHSLISFGEYRIDYIHLLILMLFKIGKFDFKEKQ